MASPRVIPTLLFLLALSGADSQTMEQGSNINISFDTGQFLSLFEGENIPLTFSIQAISPAMTAGKLQLRSGDQGVFEVRNLTELSLDSLSQLPVNVTTVIEGLFLGIDQLEFYFADSSNEDGDLVGSYQVKVKNVPTILNPIFNYMVLIWLIISYIMMGSKMQWKDIWEKVRKPWALLLAMGCQFFVMPALAFGLSKAFRLDNATSLGLIMVGTCPGGWLSNIFSLLLDCDFILSLTMTFCSTILAMGMMPFNLWLYASPLTNGEENLTTPYLDLFLQIIYLVIPIGVSMLIARFSERYRKYCGKLLKPAATLCILLAVGLGVPAQLHIYQSATVEEYAVSAILPFIGCMAGLLIAKVCCLERKQVVTVSLETGAQNSLLATTMLAFFYPFPEADLIATVPYIMAILSLGEGLIVTFIYLLARYVFCRDRYAQKSVDGEEAEESKGDKALESGYSYAKDQIPMKDSTGPEHYEAHGETGNCATDVKQIGVGIQTNSQDLGNKTYTNTAFAN